MFLQGKGASDERQGGKRKARSLAPTQMTPKKITTGQSKILCKLCFGTNRAKYMGADRKLDSEKEESNFLSAPPC